MKRNSGYNGCDFNNMSIGILVFGNVCSNGLMRLGPFYFFHCKIILLILAVTTFIVDFTQMNIQMKNMNIPRSWPTDTGLHVIDNICCQPFMPKYFTHTGSSWEKKNYIKTVNIKSLVSRYVCVIFIICHRRFFFHRWDGNSTRNRSDRLHRKRGTCVTNA